MTNEEYFLAVKKSTDISLQMIETILLLGEGGTIEITEELREMLEYTLEINFQVYRLTNENLKNSDYEL